MKLKEYSCPRGMRSIVAVWERVQETCHNIQLKGVHASERTIYGQQQPSAERPANKVLTVYYITNITNKGILAIAYILHTSYG